MSPAPAPQSFAPTASAAAPGSKGATAPPSLQFRKKKQKQNQALLLCGLGLLVLIACAGGGWLYYQSTKSSAKKNDLVAQAKTSAKPKTEAAANQNSTANGAAAKNVKGKSVPAKAPPAKSPLDDGEQRVFTAPTFTEPAIEATPAAKPPKQKPETTLPESLSEPAKTMPAPIDFAPSGSSPIRTGELPGSDKAAVAAPLDELTAKAIELYKAKKLFNKTEYAGLRKLAAAEFAKEYDVKIREGLGADYDAMQEWFAKHTDVQEEFYLAIDSKTDNIPGAFKVMNALRKEFPEKLAAYGSLAIATAVVWDNSRDRDHNEYMQHVSRAKAKVEPSKFLDAVGNFRYLVEMEPNMQGRAMYSPWEFLVYLVDHRTPRDEREWSLQNFGRDRTMFGSCYSKVPYDYTMLNSGSNEAKLNNQEYTLPNILKFGGVCSYQADFASRVGKNIGVPAAYVTGEGSGLELHAWVMWVELKQVTATTIKFTLESHGRYGTDHYYVGEVLNPQTSKEMTDRELEIDLQATGMDVAAKRQVELLLSVYPRLKEELKFTHTDELAFLRQLLKLSPGWRGNWVEVAKLARANAGNKTFTKPVMEMLEQMFLIYARVPDFTWQVFDDFAAFEEDPKRRLALYERLCVLYEVANRPDLACEARMKYAGMLVEAKRTKEAVDMLANCVKKFPNEGRYIPKVLDKIDALCAEFPNSGPVLVQFYAEFLPLVKKLRGNTPTDYAIKMYTRAAALFEKHQAVPYAEAAKAELAKLTGGKGV
jgi:hypothetical protein